MLVTALLEKIWWTQHIFSITDWILKQKVNFWKLLKAVNSFTKYSDWIINMLGLHKKSTGLVMKRTQFVIVKKVSGPSNNHLVIFLTKES